MAFSAARNRYRSFSPAVPIAILVATALQTLLFVSCDAQAPAPAPSYCESGLLCGSACQHPLLFSQEDWVLSFYSREHCPVVGPLAPETYSYATVCGNLSDCFHCFNLPSGFDVQSAVVTARLYPDPATLQFAFYDTSNCPEGTWWLRTAQPLVIYETLPPPHYPIVSFSVECSPVIGSDGG